MIHDPLYKYMLVCITAFCLAACQGNDPDTTGEPVNPNNSDSLEETDSTMSVHLKDPANAFPLPPVTGTQKDSGYVEDSLEKR